MADIFGRIIKPTSEFIEDLARKLPEAFGKGHHRIGQHIHKAADEFDKAEDDVTAKAGHHPHNFGEGHHDPEDVAGTGTTAAAAARSGQKAVNDADHQAARTGNEPDPDNLRPADSDHVSVPGGEKHCETDPVDVATGDMIMPAVDVALPGALPLLLERTHISSYRHGRLFGTSWTSTLDQRLQLDADGVVFAAADGMRLEYPPPHADGPVVPLKGPRLPLLWSGVPNEPMTVLDPRSGHALIFDDPRSAQGVHGAVTLRLTAIEDRNGRRIDIAWSERDLPELITHHGGYRVAVDPHPHLPRIIAFRLLDTNGHGTSTALARYGYSTAGDLTEVYNSSGTPLRLTYDDDHRITSWSDRTGTEYRYEYDTAGRVVRTDGSDGFMSGTFAYDDTTRTTRFINSLGHITIHQHNDAYRLIRSTDPLGNVTVQEWSDDNRLLKSVTDPMGRTSRFGHDAAGNVISVRYPNGAATTISYDGAGHPVEMTDGAGRTWRTEYDDRGNRLVTVDPAGARTTYTYDEKGDLIAVTDAVGVRREVVQDAAGLPVSATDPLGTTTARRDAFGRVVQSTDAMGNVVRIGWTVEGQVTWCERSDGRRETWTYDAEGNVIGHTDADGRTTTETATHFDLTSATTARDGKTHRFVHDSERRLVKVINPLGLTWDYVYDAAGRLVGETDFDGRALNYAYDAAGMLVSRTNGAGETATFTRDELGRVVEFDDGAEITRYAYDAAGNLERSSNADADIVRDHDALGRVLTETVNGRRTTFTYDALGRPTTRTTPTGIVSTWSYDHAGLPAELDLGGHGTAFAFDVLGRETLRTLGDGLTLSQTWDSTGRLTAQTVTHGPGRPPLQHRAYTYRSDDILQEIDDLATGNRRFDLDRNGRVTAVHARDWTEEYAYDAVGNLTRSATPLTRPDEADRQFTGTRLRRGGRTVYEHDGQGRLVRAVTRLLNGQTRVRTYTWNRQDQLVGAVTPEGTQWRYVYDPAGRRVAKERLTADGKVAQAFHFTWAGTRLAEQETTDGRVTTWEYAPGSHRALAQLDHHITRDAGTDGNGGSTPDGERDADAPAASPQSVTDARFHAIVTDLVGTPTELLTSDGTVAWQQHTTLWGVPTTDPLDSAVDCPLRFPGQYADQETGWNYNHFRYYDPATGHYTSVDPLGLGPSPNPSAYVPNPQAWTDPLGLAKKYRDLTGWEKGEPTDPTWGGRVVYGKPDGHGRATSVTAVIHQDMLGQVTGPKGSARTMPGWDNKAVYNKTHLLAASLGGSNSMPGNFVVAHRNANAPIMSYYEGQVADAVSKGHVVTYSVTPIYKELGPGPHSPEDLRPIGMTIRATSPQGFTLYAHSPEEDDRRANRAAWEKDPHDGFNEITILNVPKRCT